MSNQDQDSINKAVIQYSGRNLTTGGEKSPLKHFKGRGTSWGVERSPFPGDESRYVTFSFDRVEVLRLEEGAQPYPYDTAEIKVKHSGSLRSQFGILMASFNEACGLPQDESDLGKFPGESWEWDAYPFNWGRFNNATEDVVSDVWKVKKVVASATTASATASEASNSAVESGLTGEALAFSLLHGRNKADFVPDVVNNAVLKNDAPLFSSILGDQWLATKIQSGEVILNEDQTHTVISMAG